MESIKVVITLGLALTLGPAFLYPYLAAAKDAIQIEVNGRLDTLKRRWHAVNVKIRALVFVSLAGYYLVLGYLAQAPGLGILTAVIYCGLTAALFWLLFDRRLNRLRGLDPGYLSTGSGGALTDKLGAGLAGKAWTLAVFALAYFYLCWRLVGAALAVDTLARILLIK